MLNVPAPGGSVGLKTLAVYTLGATAGIVAYEQYVSSMIPDSWEAWKVGPITGQLAFAGLFAILGAGIASKFVK